MNRRKLYLKFFFRNEYGESSILTIKWRSLLDFIITSLFFLGILALFSLSIAGYFGELHHAIDLTSHFKVQYLLLSLVPFTFFVLKFNRKRYKIYHNIGLILSLSCITLNLLEIVPWYLPRSLNSNPTSNHQSLRILLSNVDKYHAQYPQVIALTRDTNPDIAVFLEVGRKGAKELEILQNQLPYSIAHQDVDIDGTAIYSKFPFRNPAIQSLGGGRKAVILTLDIQGTSIELIAVHPSNAVGAAYVAERNRQLDAIATYINSRQNSLILAGDLNTTMWSPHYKRSLGNTSLYNTRKGFGILPTWTLLHPFFAIPIDHILVSHNIQVKQVQTGRAIGSDHLPLIADLNLPSSP